MSMPANCLMGMITYVLGCHGDLCADDESDDVFDHIHEQSTPRGGVNAGVYKKVNYPLFAECF